MARPKTSKRIVRISISIDDRHYQELRRIADNEEVSLAWLVRRAVADFLEHNEPLDEQIVSSTKVLGR
ncbi:ribbon-helix-helix protein, CopG family [Pseudovibrio exalbescens]|uniref:Ribbon-helix-helix protein CopG domain-containing protein n=1 Tax=Pseudovibrio exalbescens TaxID=197461 RepID=A0A1U7JF33_9HYPH|nr:ribbon-helix-helix protein, CopG family [Pseudovibrio exalbescens]OKL43294.1 hypothetical protein A3843_14355 [Pseudovibrio exalbescens]